MLTYSNNQPKRKRAYHRALKRGESWALMKKGLLDLGAKLAEDLFKPSPFLKMIGLGKYLDEKP